MKFEELLREMLKKEIDINKFRNLWDQDRVL